MPKYKRGLKGFITIQNTLMNHRNVAQNTELCFVPDFYLLSSATDWEVRAPVQGQNLNYTRKSH